MIPIHVATLTNNVLTNENIWYKEKQVHMVFEINHSLLEYLKFVNQIYVGIE